MYNLTIDTILEKLKYERDRRTKAIESNNFCDNKTCKINACALDAAINAMTKSLEEVYNDNN